MRKHLVGNQVTKWVQVSLQAANLITWNSGTLLGVKKKSNHVTAQ
jgi:hypothetical protein